MRPYAPRTFFILAAAFACAPLAAQFDELDREASRPEAPEDPAQSMQRQIRGVQDRMASDVSQASSRMQAQYDQLIATMAAQREELRRRVSQQWTDFHEPTIKEWVDYSPRADAVSRVDFEEGTMKIEALVPVEDKARLKTLAIEKIAERADSQKPLIRDLVKSGSFDTSALAAKIVIDEKPVIAADGKPRFKAAVEVKMVPDHLRIRAKRHEASVMAAAKKYGLDPALVFAVIHTESYFNPRARSAAPAFGLMQLMPRTGALEAYQFLHKKERILGPEELYDPDQNILLGATYLHMLQSRHFAKVKNLDNRRTLSIAAYNCGPGCVRKNILSKYDADAMSNDELVAAIKRLAPKETQHYVPRVQERMELYRRL